MTVYIYDQTSNTYEYTTSGVLQDGVWVHLTVVYDGNLSAADRCKIYINGQLDTNTTSVGTIPTTLHTGSQHWFIGTQDGSSGFTLDGKMDEFRLYSRALSASDVAELYSRIAGSMLFNGDLTNANSKLQNTTAKCARSFNGSDDLRVDLSTKLWRRRIRSCRRDR